LALAFWCYCHFPFN